MTKNNLILAPDDLEPGVLISIYARKAQLVHRRGRGGRPSVEMLPSMDPSESQIPGGAPMRVISIALPYIACAVIQPDGEEAGPLMIDLRKNTLMRLEQSYVDALVSFGRRNQSDTCDPPQDSVDGATKGEVPQVLRDALRLLREGSESAPSSDAPEIPGTHDWEPEGDPDHEGDIESEGPGSDGE